jgi:hypothetical protein
MESGGNEKLNGRRGNADPVQLIEEGRKDQVMGNEPCLVADGNGCRFDASKIEKGLSAERVFETLEKFPLRVLGQRDSLGPEGIRPPGWRKIKGHLPFPVGEFKMGCHYLHLRPPRSEEET